ncbi:hypothetical protein FZEAL_7476 [Fusarium zealandicum]|uniref:RNase MRP protein 1 RNA binding domain-containing protein n=1 Tax=Fusarium zealandicum TaxID=1053134 RepID=A0A8H4UGK2_9HYPO|nr:hypothetical protein FZEAL_7476 [Fusarium zealandicum]
MTDNTAAIITTTADSLTSLLVILAAFNHRHRNQHSSSHWWSSFSLVRRAARHLATDLVSHTPKTKKKSKSGHAERIHHPALARASWMTRHVVPRAYVAFSQLATDNQHAPLGLLLLSVLARINRLLSDLVPADNNPAHPPLAIVKPTPSGTSTPQLFDPTETSGSGMDMGVAVSRNELVPRQKSATPQLITKLAPNSHKPPPKELKSKKLSKDAAENSSIDIKEKPKKKKKKAGDALSSLFGSL